MAELTIPDTDFEDDLSIDLDQNYQVNRSAWTGRRRGTALPGAQRWFVSATRVFSTEDEERPWRAFLLGLKGPINKFRWPIACSQRVGSNPVVGSSPGNGFTLPLSGLPASVTVLEAGRFMTVPLPSGHHRAVMLTANLVSNGSGIGTATFVPNLNEVPTVGATVETIAPYIMAALIDPRQGITGANGTSSLKLDAEEAL